MGSSPNTDSAVLLGVGRLSPFSVVCNTVPVSESVFVAPTHCVEAAEYLAVGGESVCTSDDWTIYAIAQTVAIGDDLWAITWRDDLNLDELDMSPQHAIPIDTEVEIVGFGRRDGNGSYVCSSQRIAATVTDGAQCRSADPGRLETYECIDSSARLCPSWSGAGVYLGGTPVAVVSAGTSCQDPGGITIAPRIPTPSLQDSDPSTLPGQILTGESRRWVSVIDNSLQVGQR